GLLRVGLQVRPARLLRHPEHVFGQVFVAVLGGGRVFRQQRLVPGLEGVGDVLEEDEPEHHVLVVGGLHVAAQLVGGLEKLGLEAAGSAVVFPGGVVLSHAASILYVMPSPARAPAGAGSGATACTGGKHWHACARQRPAAALPRARPASGRWPCSRMGPAPGPGCLRAIIFGWLPAVLAAANNAR